MSTALEVRLRWLREAQNADGGWGFFAGKQSWLEPTAYAMLALSKDADAQEAVERGWKLIGAWQSRDGSWRPCASVDEPHWTTSLAITLHCVRARHDEVFRKGVAWLLGMTGSENRLGFRMAHFINPKLVEMNPSLKAWPWTPGNSSWIEPTAHALVALKRASAAYGGGEIRKRIEQGEQMILDRRCSDGGWNYGNRRVLGHDLPSYPETTAIALYGLQGKSPANLQPAVDLAKRYWNETHSPLARAWLAVALRAHSTEVAIDTPPSTDVIVTALETIALTGVLA